MTDRRATDLSFGHLGKASYDVEGQRWGFSANSGGEQHVRQALPLKECLPPSIPPIPEEDGNHSVLAKTQLKRLLKAHPEIAPGKELASNLSKSGTLLQPISSGDSGDLLAIGRVVDNKKLFHVMALPCGESGHVLRLIRLQTPIRSRKRSVVSSWDLGLSDQGYWMGTGGTIRQIIFSDDTKDSNSWLAVQQATATIIFHPTFGQLQPASLPSSSARIYPPSRLHPNPVALVTAEKTRSRRHVDVSFNPWYSRQFILIDSLGYWYIWSIETQKTMPSYDLVAGKRGRINNAYPVDYLSKSSTANAPEGWYRALWVCNINTIAICSRRSIAVFDLNAKVTRLRSVEFSALGSDLIIDMKRSLENQNYLFVLTASRIFWIEITPTGELAKAGAKILISYRHFHDISDETLRLVTLKDDNVSAIITSRKSSLVNVYGFSTFAKGNAEPTSWYGSFVFAPKLDSERASPFISLYFSPAPFMFGPDTRLADRAIGVRFMQVWALSIQLALSSTVCVFSNAPLEESKLRWFLATTSNVKRGLSYHNVQSRTIRRKTFVVPSGVDDEYPKMITPIWHDRHAVASKGRHKDMRLTINWERAFKAVFMQIDPAWTQSDPRFGGILGASSIMTGFVTTARAYLQQAKQDSSLAVTTLLELSNCSDFSEELEKATTILHDFLQSLQQDGDSIGESSLMVSNLTSYPTIQLQSVEQDTLPSFLKLYDHIVEIWMASQPPEVPVTIRVSKYKIIREVAIELCLSSIACSVRGSGLSIARDDGDGDTRSPLRELGEPTRGTSLLLSSPEMSPEPSQGRPSGSVPRLSRTPSLYSRASSASRSESNEDLAFTRLRQYAVSIKPGTNLRKSKVLSQWVVGGDPTGFSWDRIKDHPILEDRNKGGSKKGHTKSRSHREKETRLTPEGQETASQPPLTLSGGQQNSSQHAFSSQGRHDIPMTLPDRTIPREKPVQKPKKKAKRRIPGF